MYWNAVYRTMVSMIPFYVENVCLWIKMALWDAPRRVYLDIELEKMKIERERLSDTESTKKQATDGLYPSRYGEF